MSDDSLCETITCAELLENIIKEECFEHHKIKIWPGSEPGDGYISLNHAVEVISEDRTLKLFVKAAPSSAKLRESDFVSGVFANEVFFYKTLHPEFAKFQKDRGVLNPFNGVPKCYGATTEHLKEAIVMENIKEQGYVTYDRKNTMDDEHVSFVFEHIAKFHAVSFAMKDQDPVLYNRLSTNLGDALLGNIIEDNMEKLIENQCEYVKEMFEGDNFISSKIENLTETLMDALVNTGKNTGRYSIIAQGDCWCNNIMFKYEDALNGAIPLDLKLIDWQLMRINYPVFDLSYFFYTVSSKNVLANVDRHLKTYHDILSENIRELGSNPDILYPYSVFIEQWEKFCKYGLLMSFLLIKIMLTEKNEVVNMDDVLDVTDLSSVFSYTLKNNVPYKQRIRDVLEHFINKEYL